MADDKRTDPAASVDGASVLIIPDPASTIDVTCGECGAVVDTVEYDADADGASAVASAASLLGIPTDEIEKFVKRHNADALKSARDRALGFAKLIADKEVEGRPAETYVCRNGHTDAPLEVSP